ncbi:MAG: hypothetical protein JHC93_01495 [Parachlamydiales bacterium]|nr:hypothetical protein [Parachlamydiales bacterium]
MWSSPVGPRPVYDPLGQKELHKIDKLAYQRVKNLLPQKPENSRVFSIKLYKPKNKGVSLYLFNPKIDADKKLGNFKIIFYRFSKLVL